MKYGTFKYGEEKYGASVSSGNATVTPIGALDRLKVWIALAGAGIVSMAGNATKQINRLIGSGSLSPQGILSTMKHFFLVTLDRILKPLNVQVLADSRQDLLPSIRENVETLPGKDGEIDFGNHLAPRLLELQVASEEGLSAKEKEERQILYAHYLDPTKGDKVLLFEDDLQKRYNVKYSGKIDPDCYPTWLKFTIPFKMNTPDVQSATVGKHSGSGTITNSGNAKTPILIEITGSITNPTISIGSSSISYTGTIPAGQTLAIDTGKMTASLNDLNVIDKITGDISYKLPPGDTAITASDNVTISWWDKWA